MNTYKSYPDAHLITDWARLVEMSSEEVEAIYNNWETIKQENDELYQRLRVEKDEKIAEAVKALKALGVDVYKYKQNGTVKNGFKAWFKNNVVDDIDKKYRCSPQDKPMCGIRKEEVNGVKLYNGVSPINIKRLHRELVNQYRKALEEKKYNDKLLIKSIEYAKEHGIDIEGLEPKQIIKVVDAKAKEDYMNKNYPKGTEIYLAHECDECDKYIVGDRRCSCGNVRVELVVDGDVIDGYYAYPELF